MMEEVREIAESYYEASSGDVQAAAKEFFRSMDVNGDGRVDLKEFMLFMKHKKNTQMCNESFFKMLDATGCGGLAFMDVITLHYIIKSGRPFCNCCEEFIPATFFSCFICFNDAESSFHLCHPCHKSQKCTHNHHGRALFLDNFTLLQLQATTNQVSWLSIASASFKALDALIIVGNAVTSGCTIM